jgi:hypothetical protein
MFCRGRVFLMLLCAAAVPAGCGGDDQWTADRPRPVSVHGTVLYNQQPVEGATVTFVPQDHTHAAVGRTDSSGRFQLRTFDRNDGAVPGRFQVTVSKVEVLSAGEEEPPDGEEDAPPTEEQSHLPDRYRSAESSGLEASVTEGGDNDFTFELED